ncbi:MAG: SusC/RagA family TonB-linked outer membrane protein, partial [Muribaculaceae bacterium]|nr:SusC/RagA family TonB-linked outer membrane protein [Muribaculaceae bacterium]
MTYEVMNEKSIVIVPRTKIKKSPSGRSVPGKMIHGVVTDKSGEPLIGVTIMAKGTTNGAITDVDGNFTLHNVAPGQEVNLTYVGYTPTTFKVGSQDSYSISMTENSELLDDVVVVGYGAQKKVNLTGAVSSISEDDLKDRPIDNLGKQLQGLVPNLNVTVASGQPGSGASLNVRGTTSPNGGSPLVLIDGVEGNLNRINSNDVESISVLKDAASAAIYGARASFGVILITTKSGKKDQKPTVSYSGSYSFSTPTTSTDFETRGYYSAKIADLFMSTYQNTPYTSYTDEEYQMLWDRRNDKVENPERPWVITQTKNGRKEYLYLANFDWYNYMYDNSRPAWDHNLNVAGGVKSFKYMVSGRYYEQKGVNRVQPDKFKSYNTRVKLSLDILPNLTLSNNTKFFYSEYAYKGYDSQDKGEYYNFRRPTLHALASMVPLNPDGTAVSHTSATSSSAHYLMDGYNAVLQKGKSGGHNKTRELTTIFELAYKVTPHLNLKADFSYTYGNLHYDYRSVAVEYSQYPGVIAKESESGGMHTDAYKEIVYDQNYYAANVYASYDNCWKDKHNFSGIAGYNYEARYNNNLTAKNTGLLSEDLSDFNLAKGTTNFEIKGGKKEFALMGLFYRLMYNYDGRYLFEVNGRYDGTSRFPRGKRFGFFPSFSAGYRISEEKYFEPLRSVVSNFKLRASYGSLGNQQIGEYDFIQTINTGGNMSGYSFNGTS